MWEKGFLFDSAVPAHNSYPSAISLISRGLALTETCHLRLAIGFDRQTFAFGASCPFSQQSSIRGLDRHRAFEELESWSGQLLTVKFEDQDTHTRVEFFLQFYAGKTGTQRNPAEEELEEIFSVSPTCIGVTIMNTFLILQCGTLPDRPWPLTIVAMPVYITTPPEDFRLELGLSAAGAPLQLPYELQKWKKPSFVTMHQLFGAFNRRKVGFKRFQWLDVRILGEVNGYAPVQWESYSPRSVNNIHVSYVFHKITETLGSLGLKTPTDAESGNGNNSDMLRPGRDHLVQVLALTDPSCGRHRGYASNPRPILQVQVYLQDVRQRRKGKENDNSSANLYVPFFINTIPP